MDMEEIRDLEIIRELLETRQYTNLRQKVAEINTADVAAILEEMEEEELLKVTKELECEENSKSTDPSGFGLQNVAQRMRLNYGPEYGITIKSTYGEGTKMTVTIPAVKK